VWSESVLLIRAAVKGMRVMGRLIVGLLLMLVVGPAWANTDDFPYGDKIVFSAFRNGEKIGQHTVTFKHDGNEFIVTTSVDLAVKVIGMTVYRYTLHSKEVWSGHTFQSLTAETDDDGKKSFVHAQHTGAAVIVDHDAAGTVRESMPGSLLPASHWNILQTAERALLNAQTGKQEKVHVTPLGREKIETSSGQIEADHFRYEGDLPMDQWFDSKGRWVKMAFKVKSDGSIVDYILQN
jgi:hypothetical protein